MTLAILTAVSSALFILSEALAAHNRRSAGPKSVLDVLRNASSRVSLGRTTPPPSIASPTEVVSSVDR
jgi:hypothetical protein